MISEHSSKWFLSMSNIDLLNQLVMRKAQLEKDMTRLLRSAESEKYDFIFNEVLSRMNQGKVKK